MKAKVLFFFIFGVVLGLGGCSLISVKKTNLPDTPMVDPIPINTSGIVISPSTSTVIPLLPHGTATFSPTQPEYTQSIILTGHTCGVGQLHWSPDGSLLASSCGFLSNPSDEKAVLLWSADGKIANLLTGFPGQVYSLDWSPDGNTLATGTEDGSIMLWNRAGQLIQRWQGNAGSVFAVAWSPDGKVLASGSMVTVTNPTVQLWDITGKIINTLSTSYTGGKFYNLEWSPDGKYLVGGATDYKLWKADGEQVFWLQSCAHCTPAWALAWSPDSQLWAVGNENGEAEIYDTTGRLVASMQDSTDVDQLAWSSDSTKIVGAKTLWRSDGAIISKLNLPALRVNCVAWSPDGSLFATGDEHGRIMLFSPDGNPVGALLGHARSIDALAWSPDGKILASSSEDTTVRLWPIMSLISSR